LFRRGDVWNESLVPPSSGTSGNPIAFDAYGTGPAPNFTGYHVVPGSAWVNVSGNAWKAPVPSTFTTVNFCLFGSVWGQKVSAVSSNLTAQWDFYLANGYLYVYSVGNPSIYYDEPIVPMALSNVPVINVNGQSWLTFQHFLLNWFDDYGVYVQGTSDHLVFANMEADSLIPEGTQPLGFYVDESAPGPGDIKIYNSEAHLNYDGFRFDGSATAITMVNDKAYASRDGALVDNTSAVTYSYCHFYASSLAVAGSTDVEFTSGTGPIAGAGNIAADTPAAVQVWQRYPARVTLTVDDEGMTPGADTYYAGTVLPIADALGIPVGAAITVGYTGEITPMIPEIQGWINAGRDVTAHSISHTYDTNTDALEIQYTGSGTAASLTISDNVLTITVTGASDSVSYNLAQGNAEGTIYGLNAALTGTGKFTTSYLTPCQGPYGTGCSAFTNQALLSQDLANVSGVDVKTSVYHLLLDVTRLTTDEITLSRQWMTTNLTGLPATPVYVYPGGYEDPNMEAIAAGVPYDGARGALHEGGTANNGQPISGANDTYASGFNVQDITSFGVNPSWMGSAGVTPALLNEKIQALVWKEEVWGVPWGVFWHLNELTQDDPVGGTEITNLIQDFKNAGATVLTNTGLVNWLTTGTLETGNDGNYYYKSPALNSFAANGGLDFRPTANSPVVDAGENLGTAYEIDINGVNQNSYGSGWEIGAHVYIPQATYGEGNAPTTSYFSIGQGYDSFASGPAPGYQAYAGTGIVPWPSAVPNVGGVLKNGSVVYDTSYPWGEMNRVVRCTDQAIDPNPSYGNQSKSAGLGGSGDAVQLFNANSTMLSFNLSGGKRYITLFNPTSMVCGDPVTGYAITSDKNLTNPGSASVAYNFGGGSFDWTNPLIYYAMGSGEDAPANGVAEYTFNTAGQFTVVTPYLDFSYGLPLGALAPAWQASHAYSNGDYVSYTFTEPDWTASNAYSTLGTIIVPLTNNPLGCAFKLTATGTSGSSEPTWSTNGTCAPASNGQITDGTAKWRNLGAGPVFTFQLTSAGGTSGASAPAFSPNFMSTASDNGLTWTNVAVTAPPAWQSFAGISQDSTRFCSAFSNNEYGNSGNYNNYNGDQGTGVYAACYSSTLNQFFLLNTATGIVSTVICSGGSGYNCSGGTQSKLTALGTTFVGTGNCAYLIHNEKGSVGQDYNVVARQTLLGSGGSCGGAEPVWSPFQVQSGPPLYEGVSTSTANPGTVSPLFSSSSAVNATAYDTSINPAGVNCITLVANGSTFSSGVSMNGTISGGDNDIDSSVNETYIAAVNTGGGTAILHVNTSGNCMQVVNTGVAGITDLNFGGFSHVTDNVWYSVVSQTQLWQRTITSDNTYTSTELVDLTTAGVCPGVDWSTFGTPNWKSIVGISQNDDTFAWSIGANGQQSADWVFVWSRTKGCSTINFNTGQVWAFCSSGCSSSTAALGTLGTGSGQCWGSQGSTLHGVHDGQMNWAGTYFRASFTGGGWTQGACNGNTTESQDSIWEIGTLTDTWAYNEVDQGVGAYDFDSHPSDGVNNAMAQFFGTDYNIRSYTTLRTITNFYPHINNLQDFHCSWAHPLGDDSYPWVCAGDDQLAATNSGCPDTAQCPTIFQNMVYSVDAALPITQAAHVFFHTFSCNPVGTIYGLCASGTGDYYFGPANSIGFVTAKGNFFCWATTMFQNMGTDPSGNPRSVLVCGRLGGAPSFNAATSLQAGTFNLDHWAMMNNNVINLGQNTGINGGFTGGAYTQLIPLSNPAANPAVTWQVGAPYTNACDPSGTWYPNDANPPCDYAAEYDSHMGSAFNPGGTDTAPVCGSIYNVATLAPPPVAPDQGEEVCVSTSPNWTYGSTIAPYQIWRFTHSFNTGGNSFFDVQFAISQMSGDGRFLAFSSDWDCTLGNTSGTTSPLYCGPPWVPGAVYTVGQMINPFSSTGGNGTNYGVYQVTTGGTAAVTAPAWFACDSGTAGNTVTDANGVVYTCLGTSNGKGEVFVVELARAQNNASAVSPANFGMQCGIETPTEGQQNCKGSGSAPILWPTTQAQPGFLRLHDADTYWAQLNPSSGTYSWTNLDNWLDLIAAHEPIAVGQVFTWTPCWDSASGTCGIDSNAPTGTNGIPSDLTASGSPTFNAFVTAFVQHCSAAGNCVANEIKYYEMWNEWDITYHWTGTMAQLYEMLAPAAAIIRQNVPGAVILTPSATPESTTYQADFQNWLNYENANGRISDWAAWHVYLTNTDTTINTPEVQWADYGANFLSIQQATPGWRATPWADTETNFNGSTELEYSCPTADPSSPPAAYSTADCTGMIARWQILHDSNGASGLFWYYWLDTIGSNASYEPAYYWLMQYLTGGKFTAAASYTTTSGIQTWSAPFVEANGTRALWVWTPSEAGTNYTVPSGYADYRDLNGGTTAVSAGESIAIGVQPILMEQ